MDLEVKVMTKVLIKAAIPHWSKFFDTKEEMQQALQSLRFQPERHATLEGVEQVPLSQYSVDFEQGITAPRLSLNTHRPMVPTLGAKSLIPGIRQGRIVDQSLVDEGGAFVYPQQIADLGDLPRRDLEERSKKDVLIGTTEKPKYHAGKLQGRVNPEGFMPGGFDPSQVFTIDQSPLSRYEARAQLLGGLGYLNRVAPEYHNEPAGIATRALLTAGIQPDSTANPLTAWGEPYTVDDEYFANKRKQNENAGRVITGEPMNIAMRLLKLELAPPMTQGVEEQLPMQEDIPMVDMTMGDYESPCECAERIRSTVLSMILQEIEKPNMSQSDIDSLREQYQKWQGHECQEILEWAETTNGFNPSHYCNNNYMSEADQMKYTGEPMDLAFDAIKKNLNRWFKEKWVDVSRKDKDGKHPPCGRSKASKSSKGYPKCRPSVKVSSKTPKTSGSMSEGQKRAATKRKRAKKQGVGGKPTIVKAPRIPRKKGQPANSKKHSDLYTDENPKGTIHG